MTQIIYYFQELQLHIETESYPLFKKTKQNKKTVPSRTVFTNRSKERSRVMVLLF